MFILVPPGWSGLSNMYIPLSYRSKDASKNRESVRKALKEGERHFLIGVEGAAESNGFLAAGDHISLFGGSPLAGANRDDLGPRFPSLMGIYVVPQGPWKKGIVAGVLDWKLSTPAEMDLLGAGALVSSGVDEAQVAGHGGASVMLMVRCHGWGTINTEVPPLKKAADAFQEMIDNNGGTGAE